MTRKSMIRRNQHTERNFLRSLPEAISLNRAKARLSSILIAEAICKTGSSGMCTCGIFGGDLNKIKTQKFNQLTKCETYQKANENHDKSTLLVDESRCI
jgi:hypothetical protein